MKNTTLLSGLLALLFGLAACGPAPTTALPQSIPTASPTKSIKTEANASATPMPCLLVHGPATPEALGANFEDRGHIRGPANAPVTIIEFSNYQCLACAYLEASLLKIRQEHPEEVRLVFIPILSSTQDNEKYAMQAAEAADLQGKYWEMHDLLFEKRNDWISLSEANFEAWAAVQAQSLGLNGPRFQEDFHGEVVAKRLQQALQSSQIQSMKPPILFVNSASPFTGQVDFPSLDMVVRMTAMQSRQFSACPAWVIDPKKQYLANLHTSKGDVKIELFADKAPQAVNNFVFLARSGWYDGITFYRVLPNSLVQTGDPSGTGIGNPGYFFNTEIPAGYHFDRPGIVAMDNNGWNTNGSRFIITLASAPEMEGQYTIIGQVLNGLDVLKTLTPRDPKPAEILPEGDELIKTTIEEH